MFSLSLSQCYLQTSFLNVSLPLTLYLYISLSLVVSLSLPLSLSPYVSLCLSVYLSLSLPFFQPLRVTEITMLVCKVA